MSVALRSHQDHEQDEVRSLAFRPDSLASGASRAAALGAVTAALVAVPDLVTATPDTAEAQVLDTAEDTAVGSAEASAFIEELARVIPWPLTVYQREVLSLALTRAIDAGLSNLQHA